LRSCSSLRSCSPAGLGKSCVRNALRAIDSLPTLNILGANDRTLAETRLLS